MIVRWSHSRVGWSVVAFLVLSGGAVVVAGCGGAAPEAATPSAKSPEGARSTTNEPDSIEEAEAQIAFARTQLGGDSGQSRFAPPPAPAPMSPGSTPSASTTPAPPAAESSAASGGADRCASPCRALASMRRAVTALCRMTGNDDTRCTDAKRTLIDSEGRVAPCSC